MQASNPTNAEIADRLTLFAALLEIAGTNTFAVRAYRRAAALIRATPASVAEPYAPVVSASSEESARASS